MNSVKLIMLVIERRGLWERREPNYHEENVKEQLWQEVATEMKWTVDKAKEKWIGLRGIFRKQYLKKIASSWAFFKPLLFLNDSMNPITMDCSILGTNQSDVGTTLNEVGTRDDNLPSTSTQTSNAMGLNRPLRKRKRPNGSNSTNDVDDENEVGLDTDYFVANSAHDFDYEFTLSILPYLQSIRKERKLKVRQKLLKVIIEEIEQPLLHC